MCESLAPRRANARPNPLPAIPRVRPFSRPPCQHPGSPLHWRIKTLLLQIAALALASASSPAKPWPKSYDAPRADWRRVDSASGFAYRTNSYLILCSQQLGHGRLDEIATTAESVREVLELFPLQLLPFPAADAARDDSDPHDPRRPRPARGPHLVRILATPESYAAAGGPPSSVGYFDGRSGEVLVSLAQLVEPKRHRSNLAPRQRYRLLVHELVHQAMGRRLGELPLWITEGLAEYLAAVQFAPGRYRFDNCSRALIDHLYTVWAHDRRKTITVPRLATLAVIGRSTWASDNAKNEENAYAKYAASLLLVDYQLRLASRGRGGLRAYLATEPDYEPVPDEHRERRGHGRGHRRRAVTPDQSPIWKDQSPVVVQRQLTEYWNTKGLDLRFAPLRPRAAHSSGN